MWIFLNNAFLSIVEYRDDNQLLMVRARLAGDIEQVFPDYEVKKTPNADYLYRAVIEKAVVSDAIAQSIQAINYDNFKNSVPNHQRHDAYLDVWTTMSQLQEASRS